MLRAGIVGLPNVGKSTLFNAVTRTRKAEAANYPFCTIDPNVGVVTVPDDRLEPLARHVAGTVDPTRDIGIITTELVMADLEAVTKRLERVAKDAKRGDKIA